MPICCAGKWEQLGEKLKQGAFPTQKSRHCKNSKYSGSNQYIASFPRTLEVDNNRFALTTRQVSV